MADSEWGKRDSRGEWVPENLPVPSPIFSRPWRIKNVAKYLFAPEGFLWPWNLFFAGIAVVSWLWFTPGFDRTAHWAVGWVAEIYARNAVLLLIVAGGLHLRLYATRGQGTKYKYTSKWMATHDSKFLFHNQTWDNIFWNFVSAVPIWTAYEAVTLWAWANHKIPSVDFRSHPVYFILVMIIVLFWRQFHFYWVHRLIHWKPLYNAIHFVHHKNVNVGPWSGVAMHPLEHLVYFSVGMIHWILPSHPIHVIFNLQHAGLTPALGHAGFDKIVTKDEKGLKNEYFFHYLHHRFFTVNFGTEAVPLDQWFGSFHDGSTAAHDRMMARRAAKRKNKMPDEGSVTPLPTGTGGK
jgi:sterol desaturase/sphingolipid hydroxylase (fatty acid hydroxylase superfamily)